MLRTLILVLAVICGCFAGFASEQDRDLRKDAAALRGHWNSLFRDKTRDSDSVRVTYKWYLAEGQMVHVFRSGEAIKTLLEAIEVVEDHDGASVACFGTYRYEFMRDGQVIADLSDACSALFWRDGPWVGTPWKTQRSKKSLLAWSQKYPVDR
jgi:hypothetical protein